MRKLSRTRLRGEKDAAAWVDRDDRPPGIPGATVTSKPHIELDLSNLCLHQPAGVSVTSSAVRRDDTASLPRAETDARDTVSLSDGTSITFATVE